MKKTIAIILSVLMLISVVSIAAVNAAADTAIEVNGQTYDLEIGNEVTYTLNMTTPEVIENGQFILYYPSGILTVGSVEYDKEFLGAPVINYKNGVVDEIDFNFSNHEGYDFTQGHMLIKVNFTVTGTEAENNKIYLSDKEGEIVICNLNDVEITDKVQYQEEVAVNAPEVTPTDDPSNPDDPTPEQPTDDPSVTPTNPTDAPVVTPTEAPVVTPTDAPAVTPTEAPKSASSVKKANPIKVTAKTKAVKAKKLKAKKQTVKALKVKGAQGTVTFAKVKKGTTAKIYKKVSVNKKNGKITLKKGKYAKKTYKVKVKITAKGNSKYNAKSVTKVVKIKVK